MSVIALIPARGGSRRIPRKNVLDFCGKPMIAWSIETARASGLFDAVVVSTDDAEIREVALRYGAEVPFQRPPELADEHSGIRDVIVHGIQALADLGRKPSLVCCLVATAPMVRAFDLRRGLEVLEKSGADFAYSVAKYLYPLERALRIRRDGRIEMRQPEHRLTRSQELETYYHDAAQFYWGRADSFLDRSRWIPHPHSAPVILPAERVQDIDHMEDWRRAQWLFRALQSEMIQTERLILRPMSEEDAPFIVRWRNQESLQKAFEKRAPLTLESHLAWFNGPRPGRIDYVMERRGDGMPVGTLHFKNIDAVAGVAESGRLIGEEGMRGLGLGRESAMAWFAFGFKQLGLNKIYGITHEANLANISLNRSLGYEMDEGGSAPPGFIRMVLTRQKAEESGWLQT